MLPLDRDLVDPSLLERRIMADGMLTVVLSNSNVIPNSSIASIVIRRPSRMLLKMMTRHSSFSFLVKPSFVYINRICFNIVDFPLSPAPVTYHN